MAHPPAHPPELAVAFTIRECFSWTLGALRRLYAHAGEPFTLYFVDGAYPAEVRPEIERFLAGRSNVVRIAPGRFVYPSEALNFVAARAPEPWLLHLQNDVLVGPSTIPALLATARRLGADVVAPMTLDTDTGVPEVHRDGFPDFGVTREDGRLYITREVPERREDGTRRIDIFELHCFLAATASLRALGPLPPLNLHEHIDLYLSFWQRGARCFMEPAARALFMDVPPLRLRRHERPYFEFRWDPVRGRQSDAYMREKWPLADLFDGMVFIERQHIVLRPEVLLPPGVPAFEEDRWPEEIPGPATLPRWLAGPDTTSSAQETARQTAQ